MPTNQIQPTGGQAHVTNNKHSSITKSPPSRPAPLPPNIKSQPSTMRGPPAAPPPPPPPPPRDPNQYLCQTNIPSSQLCPPSSISSTGSSMSSLNPFGRLVLNQAVAPPGNIAPMNHSNQRNLIRPHGDTCSSRSSISSHSSLQHHLSTTHLSPNSGVNVPNPQNTFPHQAAGSSCSCSASSNFQHVHINQGGVGDGINCNHNFEMIGQDSRTFIPVHHCSGCCSMGTNHHFNGMNSRFPSQNIIQGSVRTSGTNDPHITTISRNALFHNPASNGPETPLANHNGDLSRHMCASSHSHSHGSIHHHHHHVPHHHQIPPGINMVPVQPVDPNNQSCNRCTPSSQGSVIGPNQTFIGDQTSRQVPNCLNHVHRINNCSHHHHVTNCCDHHIPAMPQPVANHNCGDCPHMQMPNCQFKSNVTMDRSACNSGGSFHNLDPQVDRSAEGLIQDSAVLSSAHNHNLSNSSTTTHTSNVPFQQYPYPNPPYTNKNIRSSSSLQCDQYGQSSAASTSSATASLSSYHNPAHHDDTHLMYPRERMLRPLPPMSKSRPASPNRVFQNSEGMNRGVVNGPIMATTFIDPSQQQAQASLSPLPPKSMSPNSSGCSAQGDTVLRSSQSLQDQRVTRLTTRAGVQNPLPHSDTPPPLPPMNHTSRVQPNLTPQPDRLPSTNQDQSTSISNFINSNLGRDNQIESRRRVEARKVELDLPQRQQHQQQLPKLTGESYGICAKCGTQVVTTQDACKAMDQIFHATCFACCECNKTLVGKTFYPVGDKVYCEDDFKVSRLH